MLHEALLGWFRNSGRDLPWRRSRDPYAVLVSEVMLQQTQVSRVIPAYESFLARFPDVRTLAAASPGAVLQAWRGLGYNRRALALHRAAIVIVEHHDGTVPAELALLKRLPGIGEYTARALLAFAFGQDAAPVDTNIGRVLARSRAAGGLSQRGLQQLADDLVPPGHGPEWSLALMDLGAAVCTSRAPRCHTCPVANDCLWQRSGCPEPDPSARSAVRPRPQGRFEGSDRYHRGRIVDALRAGPLEADEIAGAAQLALGPRLESVVQGLINDGLVEALPAGGLGLPEMPQAV